MSEPVNEAFINGLDASICDVNRAIALPALCYTDKDFYEFEKDAIFDREWLCVGRASWVKEPGEYFTATHCGEPILIVHTREGTLKAYSAVCQHRAALVAEGHGTARAFICPYHHWTYSLEGELVAAPDMERACDFDMTKITLAELRLEVWLGFIFINFDRRAGPLAARLGAVTEALAHFELDQCDEPSRAEVLGSAWGQSYPWNWKVHFENSNDSYHANKLHKGFNDIMPTSLATFPPLPSDSAGYFRHNPTLEKDAGFNPTNRALLPVFPKLTDDERQRVLFVNIPPSFAMFARVDFVTFNIFRAAGPEETVASRSWLVAPGAMQTSNFRQLMQMTAHANPEVVKQDRHVDALVQTGLRSRFAPRGRYSWQEEGQALLNRWLVNRYRAEWRRQQDAQHR